ncbi:MAG: hypothetical protein M5U30_11335 [Burkholderiaceae bacterium]|nr:hypothetical protein [Burkholderiaceae bacterium]
MYVSTLPDARITSRRAAGCCAANEFGNEERSRALLQIHSRLRHLLKKVFPLELGPPLGLESVAGLTVGWTHEATVAARERIVLHRRITDRQVRGALARGRLCLAHRPIRQLAYAAPAKPLRTLREQDGALRVDMTPERVRVADCQGPKPNTIVIGLRPPFEKRRHLAQPLLHLRVLVREGVHRSAVAR